jgi:hypothetical protein
MCQRLQLFLACNAFHGRAAIEKGRCWAQAARGDARPTSHKKIEKHVFYGASHGLEVGQVHIAGWTMMIGL